MGGLRKNSVARGVAVLLLLFAVVLYAEGQLDGPCLIDCGKKVVVCAEKCGVKGGEDSCFRECGSKNIDCVNFLYGIKSAAKSQVISKLLLCISFIKFISIHMYSSSVEPSGHYYKIKHSMSI
ncbi:Uncharacterized protein Fot_17341 [Forsythia ovata]|uniref:Uncharacterized protein n=1 Tax=Forsythia ovata TaxID=205694 RepID=A0ABD1VF29_9LAMI